MLTSLVICLILTISVFTALTCPPLALHRGGRCAGSYEFLPTTCEPNLKDAFPDIYDYCNTNRLELWKTGVTDGSGVTNDLTIDHNFIFCWEDFASCGYVPFYGSNSPGKLCGQVKADSIATQSGVRIGAGVDLGQEDISTLQTLQVALNITKLQKYIGLTGDPAWEKICDAKKPLIMSQTEAYDLSIALMDKYSEDMETWYNAGKAADALSFSDLPVGIKTVSISIAWKWGYTYNFPTTFFDYIKLNDFESATKQLRNWGATHQSNERLRSEANVIEASLGCVSNLDCAFLLDESGSVGASNFKLALDWVAEFVSSFDESSLDQSHQTDNKLGARFGFSTFGTSSREIFYLNSYSSSAAYKSHILSTSYLGTGTKLGAALTRIGSYQFTESRGMRSVSLAIPRLLIILTDGRSGDNVVVGVDSLNNLNLNIIVIGIAGYNMPQLQDITTDDKIYTIDKFSELSEILDGVTSQTCFVPSQLNINDILKDISMENGQSKYFQFKISGDENENIELAIQQSTGCVYVYVSYCIQYPSYYVNDVKFTSCAQPHKQIVLSSNVANCIRFEGSKSVTRRLQSQTTLSDTVYVAFEARSAENEISMFDMTITTCDSAICAVGTNYNESLNVDESYDYDEETATANLTSFTTISPTFVPTFDPTFQPTYDPTDDPTYDPTVVPTSVPTFDPTSEPTFEPTLEPTYKPVSISSSNKMYVFIGIGIGAVLFIFLALVNVLATAARVPTKPMVQSGGYTELETSI